MIPSLEKLQKRSLTSPGSGTIWMGILVLSLVVSFLCMGSRSAGAVEVGTIWGDNAAFGNGTVDEWCLSTCGSFTAGQLMHQFSPNSTFDTYWNGRGVVQVGNTLYLTNSGSNNVYMMNATTGASEGIAFSVSGSSGLSAIAYDGKNFWVGDYSGTNHAYQYTPTGTLLSTISLSNCTGYCDGLEYFNGKLISNRWDGCCGGTPVPYDVYSTSGTLLTSALISNPLDSTGIAFDGTNFWTSNINNGSLSEWSSTGAFLQTINLQSPTVGGLLVEDLSVNYAQVMPPTGVPEPSTVVLFASGLLITLVMFHVKKNRLSLRTPRA